jgi:tripeptidyl-peptidase-1
MMTRVGVFKRSRYHKHLLLLLYHLLVWCVASILVYEALKCYRAQSSSVHVVHLAAPSYNGGGSLQWGKGHAPLHSAGDTHKMVASIMRLFAAATFALPVVTALVLHEQVSTIPAGWSFASAPDNDTQIVLQVALAQQNIDQLESRLSSVSTPSSSSYGQYLDFGDINALFGPSDASKNAVTAWLSSSGINTYTAQGDSVWLKASVAQANSLLGTTFNTYTDTQGVPKIRTTQYSIPQGLKAHIDLVSPTTYFGTTQAMRSIKSTYSRPRASLAERATTLPAGCNSTIVYQNHSYAGLTPDCLRYIYNVKDYKPSVKSGSKIAFSSFLNESASFSDLFAYEEHFGIPPQKLVPRAYFSHGVSATDIVL